MMDKQCIILDFKYNFDESEQHIYPVLLYDKEDVVLVDCGYPGPL